MSWCSQSPTLLGTNQQAQRNCTSELRESTAPPVQQNVPISRARLILYVQPGWPNVPKKTKICYIKLWPILKCSLFDLIESNFQLFDTLRKERPNDLSKVVPIEGDITQPELAISPNDRATLSLCVNVVFHSAATVKFDEKLKLSVTINMLGTQRLVELCRRMSNLEALVSTADTCNPDGHCATLCHMTLLQWYRLSLNLTLREWQNLQYGKQGCSKQLYQLVNTILINLCVS